MGARERQLQLLFNEYFPIISAHFEPLWRSFPGKNLTAAQFNALMEELTQRWVRFYVRYERSAARHFPSIGPTTSASHGDIWRFVTDLFGDNTPETQALAAHLLQLSPEDYQKWLTGHLMWLNR